MDWSNLKYKDDISFVYVLGKDGDFTYREVRGNFHSIVETPTGKFVSMCYSDKLYSINQIVISSLKRTNYDYE